MVDQVELDLENTAPLDQQEDLEDLNLPKDWYFGATLWSTDWTAETLVSQMKRGNINLSPRYQRRMAWEPKRQSRFIESLILGLPVPQIILAEDNTKRGSFVVIDGKQRLLAIRQFTADDTGDEFTPLRLSGLDDRKDLNGLSYAEFKAAGALRNDLNSFENQSIRTVIIRNWKDERYLHSVFLRINTGSVQLSPQELRQALHPGPFADFIDDLSIKSNELKAALNIKEPDFRMRDVELVLRFYAYYFFAAQYRGNFKAFLDFTVDAYNKNWKTGSGGILAAAEVFEESLSAIRKVFGAKDYLRKWNGAQFESRINRAVFDIMTYYVSNENVRKRFIEHGDEIKSAFKELCNKDKEFLSSIESTTKSMEANRVRFKRWAETLSRITKHPVSSPF